MRSKSNRRGSNVLPKEASVDLNPQQLILYEGESLIRLLKSIQREIESARVLDRALPDKICLKQQFLIGVNDVTRVLERMPPMPGAGGSPPHDAISCSSGTKVSPVKLQAVLVASDCNPRWLTKHLPSLASSRKVPLIFVKDKNGGSLRLGELVKMKTAIAIGVRIKEMPSTSVWTQSSARISHLVRWRVRKNQRIVLFLSTNSFASVGTRNKGTMSMGNRIPFKSWFV